MVALAGAGMLLIAIIVMAPVAAVPAMQLVGDLGEDIEGPVLAMARAADDRVGEQVDADPDGHRAAVSLGFRGRAGGNHGGQRKRGRSRCHVLHGSSLTHYIVPMRKASCRGAGSD